MGKYKQDRKGWFRVLKSLTKGRYKECQFVYLGKKVTKGAIILSNHEGTDAPMSLELYADFPVRFWGAAEMNSGLAKLYKYQTQVYYHQKKHWNIHLARLFCLIASPLTYLFYKGLNLISTYKDSNFMSTLRESIDAIKKGDNIVIFPEKSDKGYLEVLEGFYAGFVMLAEVLLRRGIDVEIFVSYYRKKDKVYVFDNPVKYSELKAISKDKNEIATILLQNCNNLGQMKLAEKVDKAS